MANLVNGYQSNRIQTEEKGHHFIYVHMIQPQESQVQNSAGFHGQSKEITLLDDKHISGLKMFCFTKRQLTKKQSEATCLNLLPSKNVLHYKAPCFYFQSDSSVVQTILCWYSRLLLSVRDTFQNPQGMPETTGSTKPYACYAFPCTIHPYV